MATGPKAWNDWTSSLLRNLFFKVLNVLERGELASGRAVRSVEKKRQAVIAAMAGEMETDRLDTLLNFMSPRYMLYMPATTIPGHLQLYASLGDRPFVDGRDWLTLMHLLDEDHAVDGRDLARYAEIGPFTLGPSAWAPASVSWISRSSMSCPGS